MQPIGKSGENGPVAQDFRKRVRRHGVGTYLQRLAMLGAVLVVTALLFWYGLVLLLASGVE